MAGNRSGGLKAKQKNLAKDPEYYKKLGRKGGSWTSKPGKPKGFAANRDLASQAGRIGGVRSRKNRERDLIDEAEMSGYEQA